MDILILGIMIFIIIILAVLYVTKVLIKPHHLGTIKTLIEEKKYEQAISTLNQFMKTDEKNPLAHLYLAECYYYVGNYEMAMVEFKQVLSTGHFSRSATERSIRKRLADIYLKFGQLEEAQKEFVVLSKLEPSNYEHLFQIGKIFYERGMKEQALAYLDKVVKLTRNHAQTYFMLGKIFFEMNRSNESLNSFSNCLKLEPRNYEAHYYMGMILKAMNNFGKAVQEFEEAEKIKSSAIKVKSIFQKGLCKMEMGDLEGSIADFERALKYTSDENSTTIAVRYTLGLAYERQRRLLEAVEQWEKVAHSRPNFQDVQLKLSQYEDLRIDDHLKDLLTATPTTFEFICQKIAGAFGYEPIESDMLGDDHVKIISMEKSSRWRNVRGGKVLIVISRSNEDVQEEEISELIDQMKVIHGIRAVYITTGKFSPKAIRYSENRPINLHDRQSLSAAMKQVK